MEIFYKVILILVVIYIVLICLFLYRDESCLENKEYQVIPIISSDSDRIRNYHKKLSKKLYGSSFESCKSIPLTTSQGLILDSAIVCNAIKNVKNPPLFYYENYQRGSPESDKAYFFVNLDVTDFKKILTDKNSPKNILCKTKQSYDILSKLFLENGLEKNVLYTGFTSVDRLLKSNDYKNKYRRYIHIAGKSPYKGTLQVVKTWIKNPQFPTLTLIIYKNSILHTGNHITDNAIFEKLKTSTNIKLIDNFLPEEELIKCMNENGIHICSSTNEGFGHYINEARSTEAVVLYTDAPPLNEMFIDDMDGIGIYATQGKYCNDICPTYTISIESLEKAVDKTLSMKEKELLIIGKKARENFIKNDKEFHQRLKTLIA